MYRCWLFSCNKDVLSEEAVWLDAEGNVITEWRSYPNRPVDPAPYHPACAEEKRRQIAAFCALTSLDGGTGPDFLGLEETLLPGEQLKLF